MMAPLIIPITSDANATIGGVAWVGRINADQIVAMQLTTPNVTITMNAGIVITIPLTWIQTNWKPLFYDMLGQN